MTAEIVCHIDGSCNPNPGGTASFGCIVQRKDKTVFEHCALCDDQQSTSNNTAEYAALLHVLDWLLRNGMAGKSVEIRSDSQLLVEQMNDRWRIKKGRYIHLALRSKIILTQFDQISLRWIPREENRRADELSKLAL